ncbi:MAG: NAD(+)/NADH kinase [Candidatus Eremiobacteraeota bacterium]|nr:NAD(+)/NADH kinase [Candidatus Eremiobacteraeota bacterium]
MNAVLKIKQRTIALYVDLQREHARAIAVRVAQRFHNCGFGIALSKGQLDGLNIQSSGQIQDATLLVTVGGDGTLLRAARLGVAHDIPLLGINTGRLGFLTEFDEDDARINELPQLLERGMHIEERVALQAEVNGSTYFALNDVVVRKGGVSRIVPFGLCVDDEEAAHIPSDGICVATPTGSTAYFLSAGGAIIYPGVEAFGIAPLLPHTLFSRPLIVPTNSRIAITCDSEIVHANLETDGDVVSDLAPGDCVLVRRHPNNVRFARATKLNFFSRLEEKLRWGVSIKEKLR